jgi:hypothetical protein
MQHEHVQRRLRSAATGIVVCHFESKRLPFSTPADVNVFSVVASAVDISATAGDTNIQSTQAVTWSHDIDWNYSFSWRSPATVRLISSDKLAYNGRNLESDFGVKAFSS